MSVTCTSYGEGPTSRPQPTVTPVPDCDCGTVLDNQDHTVQPLPTIYALELTPTCNSRCPGCSNVFVADPTIADTRLARRPLALEAWQHILQIIAPHACRLKITGGEATLHPQFADILQAIQRYQLPFTLFTNGRWHHAQQLLELLKGIPTCQGLLISLHGAEASAHEAFTGVPGSFAETVGNIQRATAVGLKVHVNMVLTSQNRDQIAALLDLALMLGAEYLFCNRYIGPAIAQLDLPPADLQQALVEVTHLRAMGRPIAAGTCVPLCFSPVEATGCLAGITYCTIDPWGNVRPCNHAPQIAGNLLHNPLDQIWHSPTMSAWRQMLPAPCHACNAFSECRGGCRAEATLQGLTHDPLLTVPTNIRLE